MRTVRGPTDRVLVVGAGLGGLSAALRLAGAGREVTVVEREPVPGGRAGRLELDGYSFDTGPTVLTMPDLIADALDCVGERLEDWLELRPVDPLYRAHYPDGSTLDVKADVDAMAAEVERVCGAAEAAGYRRFVEFVSALYRAEMRTFIDRNLDSPLALLGPDLARLVALRGFGRLAPAVARHLKDPRTQRVFSFQAMYAGLSPYHALAVYAVIAYMDSVAGVFFPAGGMHAVPRALAGAAEKHGVRFRYGTEVTRVEVRDGRARAVLTADGERLEADVVVLNPDLPTAYRELLPPGLAPRRLARLRYSPSCVVLHVGSTAAYTAHGAPQHPLRPGLAAHLRRADRSRSAHVRPVAAGHEPHPVRPDAGPGRPADLLRARPDAEPRRPNRLGGHRPPLPGRARRHPRGSAATSASAPRSRWSGWSPRPTGRPPGWPWALRSRPRTRCGRPARSGPATLARGVENVVFAGSGTQPGVGVPMVLLSGRLAAERITGRDREYRSRAWR